MNPSTTHLVLIPSYNPGTNICTTIGLARTQWNPVWVVVDGSTDGSLDRLKTMAAIDPGLKILALPHNIGKGAAVLHGLDLAAVAGFTHALTMDSDGQHPAQLIPHFMATSRQHPATMVLGVPIFATNAPWLRVKGRSISNWWANLETLWTGIGDSLYGFRVYPIEPLRRIMHRQRWMRRFDFDPEAAVRLCWAGIRPLNLPAPVQYFSAVEGGVSHFNYIRDNILLTWMHIRLMFTFFIRLPILLWHRIRIS